MKSGISKSILSTAFLGTLSFINWGCLAVNHPPELPANEVSPEISYLWPEQKSLIKKNSTAEKQYESRKDIGNGIIAVVNDRLITLNEFDSIFFKALQNRTSAFKKEHVLYDEVLNSMIDQLLLLELAYQREIEVSPEAIDKRVEQMAKNHPKGWDGLRRELANDKSSIESLKESIKENLMMDKLRSEIVGFKNSPSPRDVQAKYQERIAEFQSPEKRDISLITIYKSDYNNDTRLIERATRKISERLKNEDFNKVLISMSGDGKGDGGLKGYIEKKDLADTISDIAFKLDSGKWSGPHTFRGILFFAKCNDIRQKQTKSLEEVQDQLSKEISMEMSYQKLSKAIENIKASSYIRKMTHPNYVDYRRNLTQ